MNFTFTVEDKLKEVVKDQLMNIPEDLKQSLFDWGVHFYCFNEKVTPLDYDLCDPNDRFSDGRTKAACSFYRISQKAIVLQKEHLLLPNKLRTVAKHEFVHALDYYLGEILYGSPKGISKNDPVIYKRWKEQRGLHEYANRNPMEYFASIGETYFNPYKINDYQKEHPGEFTKQELIDFDPDIHDHFEMLIEKSKEKAQ